MVNGSAVKGVEHLSLAVDIWHAIDCFEKEAESLNNLGVSRAASLDWSGAAAEFRKALDLLRGRPTAQCVLLNLGILQVPIILPIFTPLEPFEFLVSE